MNENDILVGEIVYVRNDEYLVDIATGADASLPFSEAIKEHQVGDKVNIAVVDVVKGEKIVSEKKVGNLVKRQEMNEMIGSDKIVTGVITGFHRGQFNVKLSDDLEGVCYIKNLESFYIENGEEFIGKEYDFNIIGMKRGRIPRFELSRENILKHAKLVELEHFASVFNVGDVKKGIVKNQLSSGVIVTCETYDCFIPKSEISYIISKPMPEVDSEVEFKIIRVEEERLNVIGSIKELEEDPWKQIEKYNTEEIYNAPITRVESYGVFVELGDNLQGLIHVSELSHDFIDDTSNYKVGDMQEFKVLNIDDKGKKVSLSTKAIYPSKYQLAKEEFTVNQHLVLPLAKFYRSGIFVTLMNKYDVFVRNEEIHNHTQTRPMLKVGSKLDFIILGFNDEKEEILLSNQAYVEKETEIFEKAID